MPTKQAIILALPAGRTSHFTNSCLCPFWSEEWDTGRRLQVSPAVVPRCSTGNLVPRSLIRAVELRTSGSRRRLDRRGRVIDVGNWWVNLEIILCYLSTFNFSLFFTLRTYTNSVNRQIVQYSSPSHLNLSCVLPTLQFFSFCTFLVIFDLFFVCPEYRLKVQWIPGRLQTSSIRVLGTIQWSFSYVS